MSRYCESCGSHNVARENPFDEKDWRCFDCGYHPELSKVDFDNDLCQIEVNLEEGAYWLDIAHVEGGTQVWWFNKPMYARVVHPFDAHETGEQILRDLGIVGGEGRVPRSHTCIPLISTAMDGSDWGDPMYLMVVDIVHEQIDFMMAAVEGVHMHNMINIVCDWALGIIGVDTCLRQLETVQHEDAYQKRAKEGCV